ncbi:MAG: cytochrome d ubiquinol oxidase subunit II [Alistipes sp.]|nr:cytochrome d ubiquinol oxidase subunit II [Alistipes sp.]
MDTLTLLQNYWWFVIALLGALLVFLLFVQGGQALLQVLGRTPEERDRIVEALGTKWELTFTTLVTFGGAFFASFPLFYSTSFGGAFYVWTAILFSFVLQPVAYEYRRKPANVLGRKTFDVFLQINGMAGPLLLGTALSTLFRGAPFTVERLNLAERAGTGATAISQWTTPWYGLDALADGWNVVLGIAVLLLAMLLACQYLLAVLDDAVLPGRIRRLLLPLGTGFVVCFVAWLVRLLLSESYGTDPETGMIAARRYGYLHGLLEMPYVTVVLAAGVAAVLWSLHMVWRGDRKAIWPGGIGTVLTVLALLLCAGWNGTSYYPSLADVQSSLTIRNSSSSLFTLRVMAYVSLAIPIVAAYVAYVWRALGRRPRQAPARREGDGKAEPRY